MTLPSSGQISVGSLRTEFGGGTPDSITEYYRGAGYVNNASPNLSIPTSGQVSLSQFYGGHNTGSVTYTGPTSGNFTVPSGTTVLTVHMVGGGGSGSSGGTTATPSCVAYAGTGGDGGGRYTSLAIAVSAGQVLSYSVGGSSNSTIFAGYTCTGGTTNAPGTPNGTQNSGQTGAAAHGVIGGGGGGNGGSAGVCPWVGNGMTTQAGGVGQAGQVGKLQINW